MSVFTTVEPEHLSALLSRYSIGTLIGLEGIADGVINTNYRLNTTKNQFVLTLVEDPGESRALPLLIHMITHLANRGIPCPCPVVDNRGKVIQQLHNRPALIVPFLPGSAPKQPSANQCHSAGKALAQMHQAGLDCHFNRDNPMGPGTWQRQIQALSAHLQQHNPDQITLFQSCLDHVRLALFDQPLPQGVCHADYFPDNTLFEGEALTGIIDFFFACREILVYDLAVALNAWCFTVDGPVKEAQFSSFLSGYQSIRPLETEEKKRLPLALEAAALRFALSRTFDSVFPRGGSTVTKKDPTEYVRRLRLMPVYTWHRLIH
ncbi:MAG: homoserine kinase [Magnetococcales bacterium]|nr:homoserine kinase [Magnetococcales bacterium]